MLLHFHNHSPPHLLLHLKLTTPATVSTQPPPIVATSNSQAQTSQPLLPFAVADFQQPPKASSQTLLKIKVFGVRKSGQFKLGVRKPTRQPSLQIVPTED
ncbi:uncharacterized protein DS421_2g47790 [Arachis hypogaea]|nr:uncharacterized protein DS421_2g47790 [Arachis hypogaea]